MGFYENYTIQLPQNNTPQTRSTASTGSLDLYTRYLPTYITNQTLPETVQATTLFIECHWPHCHQNYQNNQTKTSTLNKTPINREMSDISEPKIEPIMECKYNFNIHLAIRIIVIMGADAYPTRAHDMSVHTGHTYHGRVHRLWNARSFYSNSYPINHTIQALRKYYSLETLANNLNTHNTITNNNTNLTCSPSAAVVKVAAGVEKVDLEGTPPNESLPQQTVMARSILNRSPNPFDNPNQNSHPHNPPNTQTTNPPITTHQTETSTEQQPQQQQHDQSRPYAVRRGSRRGAGGRERSGAEQYHPRVPGTQIQRSVDNRANRRSADSRRRTDDRRERRDSNRELNPEDNDRPSSSSESRPPVEQVFSITVSRRVGAVEVADMAAHVEIALFCAEGDYDVAAVMNRGPAAVVECWNASSAATVRDILAADGDLVVTEPVPANVRMYLSVYHRLAGLPAETLVKGLENRNPGLPRGGLIPISKRTVPPREGEDRSVTWLYVDVTPLTLPYLESQGWSLKTVVARVTLKSAPRARHRSSNA